MPLQQIAKVLKANGTDGGILVGFREIDPEEISLEEPVFVVFDGLPVPFFFTDLQRRGSSKAVVHLNDVTSLKDALDLEGREILADIEEQEPEEDGPEMLVGWTLKDGGRISAFVDIPGNPCLEVETKNGTTVMVPFHEDLIESVDPENQEIALILPEGILEL